MKQIKKLGALLMALAMVLSLSVTALAANEDGSKNVTVKFTNLNADEEVTAYQMVKYDGSFNSLSFTQGDAGNGFYRYLVTTVESMKDMSQDEVIEALNNMDGKISINMISDYVTDAAVSHTKWEFPTEKVTQTAAGADTDASATLMLTPGWYLVVVNPGGNNQRNYMPTMIFVKATTGESEVYANGNPVAVTKPGDGIYTFAIKHTDAIDVTKQVWDADQIKWNDSASESVGGTLNFRVRVTLPTNLDELDQYTIELKDTMKNLTLDAGSIKVYGESVQNSWGDGEVTVPQALTLLTADTNYTITTNAGLNITMLTDSLKNNSYRAIYVTYSATLDAAAANYDGYTNHISQANNEVTLTYGTPGQTQDKTDHTDIYTYSFDLKKIGEDAHTDLNGKGAKFEIYNVDPTNGGAEPLKFVQKDDYYRLALTEEEKNNAVTEIEANFTVQGLDNGTYYLKEVATPSGYYAPEQPFVLTLARDYTTNKLSTESSLVGDNDLVANTQQAVNAGKPYLYEFQIKNSTHPQLPTTGGMGTVIFTVGGVALMGAAAVLFFATRKKKAEQ